MGEHTKHSVVAEGEQPVVYPLEGVAAVKAFSPVAGIWCGSRASAAKCVWSWMDNPAGNSIK